MFVTRKKCGAGKAGFTLIEVVVAVAIFGVITAIIFPALIQFLEVRDRVNEKNDKVVGLQKAFLFLAKDFRYASNRLGKDEFGELGSSTLIVGDDSLIDLTANYPDLSLDGLNVPRRVRWELDDGILQRVQSPVMDPDGDTRVLRQKLLSEVEDIKIELSAVEEGRSNTSKKWDEETRLPDLISIEITFENGVEYRRMFTMLGGDNLEALAATINAQANNPNGQNSPGGPDGSNDSDPSIDLDDPNDPIFSSGFGRDDLDDI